MNQSNVETNVERSILRARLPPPAATTAAIPPSGRHYRCGRARTRSVRRYRCCTRSHRCPRCDCYPSRSDRRCRCNSSRTLSGRRCCCGRSRTLLRLLLPLRSRVFAAAAAAVALAYAVLPPLSSLYPTRSGCRFGWGASCRRTTLSCRVLCLMLFTVS